MHARMHARQAGAQSEMQQFRFDLTAWHDWEAAWQPGCEHAVLLPAGCCPCASPNQEPRSTDSQAGRRAGPTCLSFSAMPSNSSMRHSPPSASTSAPASSVHPAPSCTAAAVRPAVEEARPLVMTAREASLATYFWNWLLPAQK
jgi:hypothetical protein